MNSKSKGIALITGASSGIGAVYADRLAKRGDDLILVARNEERLKALSARIIEDTGRSAELIIADLTNKVDLARVEQVLRTNAGITVGIAMEGDLASADPESTCYKTAPYSETFACHSTQRSIQFTEEGAP